MGTSVPIESKRAKTKRAVSFSPSVRPSECSGMYLARRSAWTFKTSGSVGAGYGVYAAEVGELVLADPAAHEVTLKYGGAGLGPGIGLKLPKAANRLIKQFIVEFVEREMSASVGPLSFPNSGTVYVTRWCSHPDLTREDFGGGCIFGEINIGLLKSRSATVFLLGMNLAALAALVNMEAPRVADILTIPPQAIIVAKGTGIGVGIGADIYAGASIS